MMLKAVADIGSTIPRAAAVPTGKCFREIVYKKYGMTPVQIPSANRAKIISGLVAIVFM